LRDRCQDISSLNTSTISASLGSVTRRLQRGSTGGVASAPVNGEVATVLRDPKRGCHCGDAMWRDPLWRTSLASSTLRCCGFCSRASPLRRTSSSRAISRACWGVIAASNIGPLSHPNFWPGPGPIVQSQAGATNASASRSITSPSKSTNVGWVIFRLLLHYGPAHTGAASNHCHACWFIVFGCWRKRGAPAPPQRWSCDGLRGCRSYDLGPSSPLAQRAHVAVGDQPKACRTSADGVALVAGRKMAIVLFNHAGVDRPPSSIDRHVKILSKLRCVWRCGGDRRGWVAVAARRPSPTRRRKRHTATRLSICPYSGCRPNKVLP
jgi:hypothetical protein